MRISEGEGEINYNHHSKAYKPIAYKRTRTMSIVLNAARSRRSHKRRASFLFALANEGDGTQVKISIFTTLFIHQDQITGRRAPVSIEME